MSPDDLDLNNDAPAEEYYTETVVEYVDNRRGRVVLVAILVALFLLLVGVGWFVYNLARPVNPPDEADLPEGITWVRSIYAWGDTLEETFNGPVDVATAPDGTIWATTTKRWIVGFRPNGSVEGVITRDLGEESGQFIALEGLDVDDDGNIWVCDYGRNAVMQFTPQGEMLLEIGIELPQEIAVQGDRVAVAAASGVALLDTEGNLIGQWGQRGKGEADFDLPHGVIFGEDGTVYVSDTQNRRIKAYSQDGRLLWARQAAGKQGLNSTAETQTVDGVRQNMQVPTGLAFDGAGRLLVVDPFEFQILVLDVEKEGQVVERYGQQGAEDGKFGYPTGISYDPDRDTIAVADTANNRLQVIRLPGTGGSTVNRALALAGDQPLWLCSIPLLLLLAAVIVSVMRRRRARAAESEASRVE